MKKDFIVNQNNSGIPFLKKEGYSNSENKVIYTCGGRILEKDDYISFTEKKDDLDLDKGIVLSPICFYKHGDNYIFEYYLEKNPEYDYYF